MDLLYIYKTVGTIQAHVKQNDTSTVNCYGFLVDIRGSNDIKHPRSVNTPRF